MSDNLIKALAAAKQLGKLSITIRREYATVDECRYGLDAFFAWINSNCSIIFWLCDSHVVINLCINEMDSFDAMLLIE